VIIVPSAMFVALNVSSQSCIKEMYYRKEIIHKKSSFPNHENL